MMRTVLAARGSASRSARCLRGTVMQAVYCARSPEVKHPLARSGVRYDGFMHRLILLGTLLVWLLPAANKTNLTIQVKNRSGKPVDHANVIVKFVQGHSIVKLGKGIRTAWELQTNQEGVVKIPAIPQGTI